MGACDTTRRGFLLGLLATTATPAWSEGEQPRDRGIGGTGAAPDPQESDRGIGGTGVIGTIRRFGSIVVNDLRIAYPADVAIMIDGQPAAASALKIGHVVRTVAVRRGGRLRTNRIEVSSEVVGPIELVGAGTLAVLGQLIETPDASRWNLGDRVAVFGQRRPDGTVVASLVERRDTGPTKVAGPVRPAPDGGVAIGGLRLAGVDASLVGRRVVAEGAATTSGFAVAHARTESIDFGPEVRRLSVEAYVARQDGRVIAGSGLDIAGTLPARLSSPEGGLAVMSGRRDGEGRIRVEGVRVQQPGGLRIQGDGPGRAAPGSDRAPGLPGRDGLRGPRGLAPDGIGGGRPGLGGRLPVDHAPLRDIVPGQGPAPFGSGGGPFGGGGAPLGGGVSPLGGGASPLGGGGAPLGGASPLGGGGAPLGSGGPLGGGASPLGGGGLGAPLGGVRR